jgi:hypothetical protein
MTTDNPFDTLAEHQAGRTTPLDQVRREMEAEWIRADDRRPADAATNGGE